MGLQPSIRRKIKWQQTRDRSDLIAVAEATRETRVAADSNLVATECGVRVAGLRAATNAGAKAAEFAAREAQAKAK